MGKCLKLFFVNTARTAGISDMDPVSVFITVSDENANQFCLLFP